MRRFAVLLLPVLLAGCATSSSKPKRLLDTTLMNYSAAIRWGGFDQAISYIDPEYLKAHPISTLDLERYHQVRVSYYHDQAAQALSDTDVAQIVEIGIINEHTQGERAIVDRQHWHWDPKAERWWLTTGLPDITRKE